jgi:hypothetical protein
MLKIKDPLLAPTELLDFEVGPVARLIQDRGWRAMAKFDRIGAVYDFVRNDIAFGYNRADNIPASQVLIDGYGQCNTKGTLFMALLRGIGIQCRLHGFTIHKGLQRGIVPELVYPLAPDEILHSWIEVELDGSWINLEGFILDDDFLNVLQSTFSETDTLCGYGAGTDCLNTPSIDWIGQDTYIQKTGIVQDFGVFETPDDFYALHEQSFGWLKEILYRHCVRHWMNRRVRAFRSGKLKADQRATHSHQENVNAT